MKLQAFLCDAATVRDNLLHVLGAGITRLWRPEFPAPMGADLALLLTLHPLEAEEPHRLRVVLQDADGAEVAKLDAEFALDADGTQLHPGESFILPVVVPLSNVPIPAAGRYAAEILVDGQHTDSLFFSVDALPQQEDAAEEDDDAGDAGDV